MSDINRWIIGYDSISITIVFVFLDQSQIMSEKKVSLFTCDLNKDFGSYLWQPCT